MQSVCPTATAAARPPLCVVPRALASGRFGCRARPTTALRAQCGAGAEPLEARKDGSVVSEGVQEDAGLAPEQMELLEDEAMSGEDEGRSPTDYDRRAHIFEESSRVFRALKERRDADGDGGVKVGAAAGGRLKQHPGSTSRA
ncbi:unnamed protein product [Alopecurus aequalis]